MRIKFLVGMAGPTVVVKPGDELDYPDAEAKRLCQSGTAVPVKQKPRKATLPKGETR